MKRLARHVTLGTFLLAVLLVAGAVYLQGSSGGAACEPLLPTTTGASFRPLVEETERALVANEEARRSLHSDHREAAEVELQRTATALRRLRDFYLPLVDARTHVYDAHFFQLRGDNRRAAGELRRVDGIFLAMSARSEHLARSVRLPLATLTEARSELASGAPGAADRIKQLGREVNLLILKGDLVLAGSHLEYR